MSIVANFNEIRAQVPEDVKLVAVSKFHSNEDILEVYNAGHRVFGESRMQEFVPKYETLPKDIEWHFIGHLQTNKVKQVIPCVHTIHSVDSMKLFNEIEKCASSMQRRVNCLIEVHIAQENSKYGFSFENCRQFLMQYERKKCIFANVIGLMGMATDTNDKQQVAKEFNMLKQFFSEIKSEYFPNDPDFCQLSMGMSHDFKIAIEEGSTIVRIGTSIFGERVYD